MALILLGMLKKARHVVGVKYGINIQKFSSGRKKWGIGMEVLVSNLSGNGFQRMHGCERGGGNESLPQLVYLR